LDGVVSCIIGSIGRTLKACVVDPAYKSSAVCVEECKEPAEVDSNYVMGDRKNHVESLGR
jgi:hypothetical protein